MPTLVEIWKAEGKAEGKVEGRVEGRVEGKVEGKAELILTFLRKKFHRVPKRIENAIRSMVDPTALESLAVHILDCQSLEEFEKALN